MKTSDLIQLGALAAIGFLAYEKFVKAKQPVATVTPGLQPSQQVINTPLDPNFGVDATSGWDDHGTAGFALQKVIDWAF